MFDAALSLVPDTIGRILKLLRNTRKWDGIPPTVEGREFKEIIIPIKESVQKIHADYTSMFNECIITLQEYEIKNKTIPLTKQNINGARIKIRKILITRRKKYENARSILRSEIGSYLKQVNIPINREFIVACGYYIIAAPQEKTHENLIKIAALKENFRGTSYFNTPSSELLDALVACNSVSEMKDLVLDMRHCEQNKYEVLSKYFGKQKSKASIF